MAGTRPEQWRSVVVAVGVLLTAAWTWWIASSLVETPAMPKSRDSVTTPRDDTSRFGGSRADSPAHLETEDPAPLEVPATLADSSVEAVARHIAMRRLIIPVAGVKPDELVDTYTQARSEGRVHNAIDIMAPLGAAVVAVADGVIVKLFESVRGGTTLYLLDDDGRTVYYYAHLDSYANGIQEGIRVSAGQTIAYVGDTGNATPGNFHLHFEITIVDDPKRFYSGVSVNPYPLLTRTERK